MTTIDLKPVTDIMTKDIYVLNLTDSLQKAEKMFHDYKIRHLPVVHNEKLVGMLSLADIKRLGFGDTYTTGEYEVDRTVYHLLSVEQVMKNNPKTISPQDSIRNAASALILEEFHALPVVDNGKLTGIITTTDIIKYLLNHQE